MAHYVLRTIVTMLIFCTEPSSWAQETLRSASQSVTPAQKYLLYAPQPVATRQMSPTQEGIIVQEIDVKKGDTLYDLSHKFSGHGMYFPQILLFNKIHNPNLIYPGNKLKVPITNHVSLIVAPPASPQNTEISLSELRSPETAKSSKSNKSSHKKKIALPARNKIVPESESPAVTKLSAPFPASYTRRVSIPPAVDAVSGQKLFEAAVKAYRVDDCRTALELLDRFLADNSGSPLAADANLYKAECYLKLSAQ